MPQVTPNEQNGGEQTRSSRTISSWWHKIHFSGRVIMCSVLFGLGTILIGSIVYVINMDDGTNTHNESIPDQLPVKPPKKVIGPVLMGIGCFIVTVGIVMCLFETQVCRKRTADSSPLISEKLIDSGNNDSNLAQTSSKFQGHGSHQHGSRKVSSSPKRSKGRHANKKHQKTPSPRTPPVPIETTKSFMTSSEDRFLTPPNTMNEHPCVVQTNSREAEIQTSSSLMKSFTSSGPSWNQSTEYQTPSTSFGDTSVSLENSIEDCENTSVGKISTIESIKSNINDGFLTPITLEEEKIQRLSAEIQNKKKYLATVQSKEEGGSNITVQPVQMKSEVGDYEKNENMDDETTDNKELAFNTHLSTLPTEGVEENIIDFNSKETIKEISDVNVIAEDKKSGISNFKSVSPANCQKIESKNENDLSDNTEISENKIHSLTGYNDSKTKDANNRDDVGVDLESSVSSDETVVSQDSILEKNVSDNTQKNMM